MGSLTILFVIISIGYYFFSKHFMCDAHGWFLHSWEYTSHGVHSTTKCTHCGKKGPTVSLSDYY